MTSLILSDTHLSRDHGTSTADALSRVLERHPNVELILAGDIFDLSLDGPRVPVSESLRSILRAHPVLRRVLGDHLRGGNPITLVPGNHDAALSSEAALDTLRHALGAPNERALRVSPWFVRRHGIHIEHGHLYDPDNAPTHPLADHDTRTEPLGTALMRRFIGPNDAIAFAHAHETTPIEGLSRAFRLWGPRAPWVIARYFLTAFGLCADAARHGPVYRSELEQGSSRLSGAARNAGLDPTLLEALLDLAPSPTHHGFLETFMRLYFDRIFAGVAVGSGLVLSITSPAARLAGVLLTGAGSAYLGSSLSRSTSRYSNLVVPRLTTAAHRVREATGADLVVFGHTHVEVDEPGYKNLGSFGFSRNARPYLLLDARGKAELQRTAA